MIFDKFIEIIKTKEIRNKILFVLGIFLVFRLMANIPIPGVNVHAVSNFFASNQYLGLLNLFTGGALDRVSIVMLGLGPYITATIILQLLTMIFPQIEKLYKEEGEQGRQKFNQYCRIAAAPLAALQGYAMFMLLKSQGLISDFSILTIVLSILTITAGSMILMWLGELISEKGIGNGVSLLIFAGIIAGFPNNIAQMAASFEQSLVFYYIAFFVISLVVITLVVYVNEGRRNIPVSYAKRVRGNKMYGGASTYLPLNINPAGVIPIIFAISLLMIPGMIATFFKLTALSAFFQNQIVYGVAYFLLVFIFTFFYTAVTFDPKSVSSNLQKTGGFIPGIRPGEATAEFLRSVLNRILVIGATFLGLIAIFPSLIQGITGVREFTFLIGGTALLILVSVALDTMKQIDAQLEMMHYDI
jgi:preprotein translocase subunit SecY